MVVKKRSKGETYRPVVKVIKEKDGQPTLLNINGQEYHAVARPENYKSSKYNNARARRDKKRAEKRALMQNE